MVGRHNAIQHGREGTKGVREFGVGMVLLPEEEREEGEDEAGVVFEERLGSRDAVETHVQIGMYVVG